MATKDDEKLKDLLKKLGYATPLESYMATSPQELTPTVNPYNPLLGDSDSLVDAKSAVPKRSHGGSGRTVVTIPPRQADTKSMASLYFKNVLDRNIPGKQKSALDRELEDRYVAAIKDLPEPIPSNPKFGNETMVDLQDDGSGSYVNKKTIPSNPKFGNEQMVDLQDDGSGAYVGKISQKNSLPEIPKIITEQMVDLQDDGSGAYVNTPDYGKKNLAGNLLTPTRDSAPSINGDVDKRLWTDMIRNGAEPTENPYRSVSAASDYINKQLQELQGGRTPYSDQLEQLISDFKNRGSFSWDPNTDMLYQNYLSAMQNAGQLAMKDTLGQAAGLTGGYGSTYATAAANGAYNNYLQQANEALPDFYNIARDRYDLDTEQALQNIQLVQNQDEDYYNRMLNDLKYALDRENTLYNREFNEDERAYSREQDAYNRAFNEDERDYTRAYNEEARDYARNQEQEAYVQALKEAEAAQYNNMSAKDENAVMKDAYDMALGYGGLAAVERYIESLSGYNLSDDMKQKVRDYVRNNTTTLEKVDDRPVNDNKDTFTDGTKTYTYKELEKLGISEEVLKELKGMKKGQTYTF